MKVAFAWLRSKISHISRNSTEMRERDEEWGGGDKGELKLTASEL